MYILSLVLFALTWVAIIFIYNSLLAHRRVKTNFKMALLYFVTVGLIGVFGEIALDTIYNFFVGNPLWHYNIFPIHNGYTSVYAPIIWGIYGLHLYWLHATLKRWKITRQVHLALIFCFEALLFEALLTISARYVLGEFMYYYYPGDLWHVSSFQNLPFYFICGLVIIKTIKRFQADPKFFIVMSTTLISVVVFFAK